MAKGSKGSRGRSDGGKQHRSAISGRYVTPSTAARHPRTTVSEAKGRGGGKGKKSR